MCFNHVNDMKFPVGWPLKLTVPSAWACLRPAACDRATNSQGVSSRCIYLRSCSFRLSTLYDLTAAMVSGAIERVEQGSLHGVPPSTLSAFSHALDGILNVNEGDLSGSTPLMYAAWDGCSHVGKVLPCRRTGVSIVAGGGNAFLPTTKHLGSTLSRPAKT